MKFLFCSYECVHKFGKAAPEKDSFLSLTPTFFVYLKTYALPEESKPNSIPKALPIRCYNKATVIWNDDCN